MAIKLPSEVTKRVVRTLDPDIEAEINSHLDDGEWEWMMDPEWLHEKDLIIETLNLAGWACKINQRSCVDDEVHPWWIKIWPKKQTVQ